MFQVKAQLTNTRPPKSTKPELVVSPSPGTMKISPEAASIIGVKHGDYLGVVEAAIEGKDYKYFLFKGSEGAEGESNVGSKLAATNGKGGGTLQFSSANTYAQLGGNSEESQVFDVVEEDAQTQDGVKYVPVKFREAVEKAERKSSKDAQKVAEKPAAGMASSDAGTKKK